MNVATRNTFVAIVLPLVLLLSGFAQAQNTIPEGALTLTVAAGTGTTTAATVISVPFVGEATASGQMRGVITAITSNTLTNQNAGWTSGVLSTAASPHLIRITKGAALGYTFLLSTATASTTTTVTLDVSANLDLTTLGIVVGTDTYEIIPCPTLLSTLGTPATTGVLGAATPSQADLISVFSAYAWKKYYFNTTSNEWRLVGFETKANNLPILPSTGILYSRLANTPMVLKYTGRIPSIRRCVRILNGGNSFLSNGWPTDVTLTSSGIHQLSGWASSTTYTSADSVLIMTDGVWVKYYHDGTQWRLAGANTPSNEVILRAGSAVLISKLGTATGSLTFTQDPPYSLP